MSKPKEADDWLTSKEAEKALRVDSCELMHLRLEGRLQFQKQGNAFMYLKADVDKCRRDE